MCVYDDWMDNCQNYFFYPEFILLTLRMTLYPLSPSGLWLKGLLGSAKLLGLTKLGIKSCIWSCINNEASSLVCVLLQKMKLCMRIIDSIQKLKLK